MPCALCVLRLNKADGGTMDILSLFPHVGSHFPCIFGSLSETKRETIFEKPSFRGEAFPRLVHRLALVQCCLVRL